MGSNFATEMADGTLSEMGIELTMEQQIGYHLQGNLYPPVPLSMVKPCVEAIDAYWADDWRREIKLPKGISYRGKSTAPAWSIIEGHRLEAWTEDSLDD